MITIDIHLLLVIAIHSNVFHIELIIDHRSKNNHRDMNDMSSTCFVLVYMIPQGIDIGKIRLFLFPTEWILVVLPTGTSSLASGYYLFSFIQYLIMCPLRSLYICLVYIYIYICRQTNGDLLFFRLIFVYASSVYEIEWEAFISNNDGDDRT